MPEENSEMLFFRLLKEGGPFRTSATITTYYLDVHGAIYSLMCMLGFIALYYRDGYDGDLENIKHSTYDIGQACTYANEMELITVPKCDKKWSATLCLSKYRDTNNDKLSVGIKYDFGPRASTTLKCIINTTLIFSKTIMDNLTSAAAITTAINRNLGSLTKTNHATSILSRDLLQISELVHVLTGTSVQNDLYRIREHLRRYSEQFLIQFVAVSNTGVFGHENFLSRREFKTNFFFSNLFRDDNVLRIAETTRNYAFALQHEPAPHPNYLHTAYLCLDSHHREGIPNDIHVPPLAFGSFFANSNDARRTAIGGARINQNILLKEDAVYIVVRVGAPANLLDLHVNTTNIAGLTMVSGNISVMDAIPGTPVGIGPPGHPQH